MATQPVTLNPNDFANLPPAIRQAVDNSTFQTAPANNGGQPSASNGQAIASVNSGDPDHVNVEDMSRFRQGEAQTVGHEGFHVLEENMPPTEQAKIPADNPNAPYDISDIDQLREQGHTMATIPREKAATIVQKYVAQPSSRKALQPWIDDLSKIPQSTIMPTEPGQQGINTTPRAPGPPVLVQEGDVHNPPPTPKKKQKRDK